MALKYYPLTRIIQNQYTRGNEFLTPDGKPYAGRYYTTYNGTSYTGINPVLGTNQELTPISEAKITDVYNTDFTGNNPSVQTLTQTSTRSYTNSLLQSSVTQVDTQLTELTPYYPVPLDSDYTRGYFTRYFAKSVTGPQYVIEISKLDWSKIQNGNVSNTILGYETTDMLWQLTGPLHDTRISQYQVTGGVYDTNKRVTEGKQVGFRGIVEFIGGEYTKYAQITP